MGFLIQNVQDSPIQLSSAGKERLCEYSYSIYSAITEPNADIFDRYQLTCAGVSCFKIISSKYDKSFILAFLK